MARLWLAAWSQRRRISLGTRASTATAVAVAATAASITTITTSGVATTAATAATSAAASTYGVRNRTRRASGPAASWPASRGTDVGRSRSGHRRCWRRRRRRRRHGYGGWHRRSWGRAGPRGGAVAPGRREPFFCGGAEPVCAWLADVAS